MTEGSISKTKLSDTILLLRPSSMLDNYAAPEMIEHPLWPRGFFS